MIEANVQSILEELKLPNPFGERITLVAAVKTRTPEEINRALKAGIQEIGDNRVQEFREKYDEILPCKRHFIGRLQRNKVKYLIGKIDLYQSLDSDGLADEIALRSERAGIVSNVLVELNLGNEESKGGFPLEEGYDSFLRYKDRAGLCVKGFMAMLPRSDDEGYLEALCKNARALFEEAKNESNKIEYLSMGMSGDWRLAIRCGSNMVRIGTALFGERGVH